MPILVDVLKNFFRVARAKGEEIFEISTYPISEWSSFWNELDLEEEENITLALPTPLVFTCSRFYRMDKNNLCEILDFELEKTVVDLENVIHVELIDVKGGCVLLITELTSKGMAFLETVPKGRIHLVSSRPLFLSKLPTENAKLLIELEDGLLTWSLTTGNETLDIGEIDLSLLVQGDVVNTLATKLRQYKITSQGLNLVFGGEKGKVEELAMALSSLLNLEKFEVKDDISGVVKGMASQ